MNQGGVNKSSGNSVIITTYNSPGYLQRVLEAYLLQTRLPDEVIVADDGSTRETADVVAAFSRKAPFRVKHVWHEDLGFRAAKIRNEAIRACSGDYLIFSDGDCLPHRAFVSDHTALAKPGFFVQGKRMLVKEGASASFAPSTFFQLLIHCMQREVNGYHHLLRAPWLVMTKHGLRGIKTCNFAVHRDAVLAVNGFNEDFIGWGREDAEFAARLYVYGLKRRDPLLSALVYHLWHPENGRSNLTMNDQFLEDTISSKGFWCSRGISKKNLFHEHLQFQQKEYNK